MPNGKATKIKGETIVTKITTINYESLMQESMRSVMKDALRLVAKNGLPGDHHFYVSFKTSFPGVDIPDYLKEEYPDNITIVLQYEYWDLEVNENNFYITLCFNDVHERIAVPFGAVVSFVDPSVRFGIHFTPAETEESELFSLEESQQQKKPKRKPRAAKKEVPLSPVIENGSNVIALDAFRRK